MAPHPPLSSMPLLAGVPRAVVDRLGSLMTQVHVPAGQTLVSQGARNRQFVLIQDGTVRVTRDGEPVAELGAGDFVGELSLLGNGTANATVTTVTDVVVWVSSSAEFDALLRSVIGGAIRDTAAARTAA